MRLLLAAVVALLPASLGAAEGKVSKKPIPAEPGAAFRPLATYAAPAGWTPQEYANGPDAVLRFQKGLDRISLRLYGAKGSAHKNPGDFLRGPAATTLGKAPEVVGQARVGGLKLAFYKRGYPIMLGDPHLRGGAPPALATEHFVVLPLSGGLFLVAAHAYESPIPSSSKDGEDAFLAFLRTLKPLRK